jgi:hypothetical protein
VAEAYTYFGAFLFQALSVAITVGIAEALASGFHSGFRHTDHFAPHLVFDLLFENVFVFSIGGVSVASEFIIVIHFVALELEFVVVG